MDEEYMYMKQIHTKKSHGNKKGSGEIIILSFIHSRRIKFSYGLLKTIEIDGLRAGGLGWTKSISSYIYKN